MSNSNSNRLGSNNGNVVKANGLMLPNQEVPQQNFSATSPMDNSTLDLGKFDKTRHNTDMNYLLSIKEVCQLLSIGRSSVYNLINGQQLTAVKLAGRTLFRRADLLKFINTLPEYQGEQYGF